VDAQNHPIFAELKRVQQYFAKIKAIEDPPAPPEPRTASVNTEAAARIIKADIVCYSRGKGLGVRALTRHYREATAKSFGTSSQSRSPRSEPKLYSNHWKKGIETTMPIIRS